MFCRITLSRFLLLIGSMVAMTSRISRRLAAFQWLMCGLILSIALRRGHAKELQLADRTATVDRLFSYQMVDADSGSIDRDITVSLFAAMVSYK